MAVRTAPGDFDAAAVANFPDAAVGARAIIAPREASAAGDLANAGIDEEGVDLVADLGVLQSCMDGGTVTNLSHCHLSQLALQSS